jgi:hypothetical protein
MRARGIQAIYVIHGAAVWTIATLLTLPAVVTGAAGVVQHPTKALWVYLLMAVVLGQMFGGVLLRALSIAGAVSERETAHFVLPLVAAVGVGALHAAFASASFLVPDGSALPLRPFVVRLIVAVLAALAATPIVIVRSSRLSVRMGFRKPFPVEPEDRRWSL